MSGAKHPGHGIKGEKRMDKKIFKTTSLLLGTTVLASSVQLPIVGPAYMTAMAASTGDDEDIGLGEWEEYTTKNIKLHYEQDDGTTGEVTVTAGTNTTYLGNEGDRTNISGQYTEIPGLYSFIPSRNGKVFLGWFDTSGKHQLLDMMDGSIDSLANDYYAQFAEKKHLITYKTPNGNDYENIQVNSDTVGYYISTGSTPAEKIYDYGDGSGFAGWFTEPNGKGTEYKIGKELNANDGDLTLYAYYVDMVKATFLNASPYDSGANPKVTTDISIAKGKSFAWSKEHNLIKSTVEFPSVPDAANKYSKGWFVRKNGKDTKVTKDTAFSEDVSVFPKYTSGVTYHTPGGNVESTSTVVGQEKGKDIDFSNYIPASSYVLDGWYTDETGGTKVKPGTVVDIGTELYAHVYPIVNISVDTGSTGINVATVSMAAGKDAAYAVSKKLTTQEKIDAIAGLQDKAKAAGYTFKGLFTAKSGGKKVDITTATFDSDTILYARFDETAPISVAFDANGGSMGASSSTKNVKEGQTIGALPKATRDGYVLDGWYTAKSGGTKITNDTVPAGKPGDSVMYYAHWKAAATVKFDPNGGQIASGGSSTMNIDPSKNIGTLPGALRGKYSFAGWFTEKDGGQEITSDTVPNVKPGETVTYYAHWTTLTRKITYIIKTDSGEKKVVVNGTKAGYAEDGSPMYEEGVGGFVGYFTKPDGAGEQYKTGRNINSDITLYPYFKTVTLTITFTADDNTVAEFSYGSNHNFGWAKQNGLIPSTENFPVAPEKEGYKLSGWFATDDLGDSVKVDENTTFTSDTTVHAVYKKISTKPQVQTIKFNKDETTIHYTSRDKAPTKLSDLGLSYTFDPANAENAQFYVTSSDLNVMQVSGSDTLIFKTPGTTYLAVHTLDDTASASVKVTLIKDPINVGTLKFNSSTYEGVIGDNLRIGWKWGPSDADNAKFVITSSDNEILKPTKDAAGRYTFVFGGKAGTTVLTIATEDGSISDTCTVKVKAKKQEENPPLSDVKYTLTFNTKGGNNIPAVVLNDGETFKLPTPVRAGYKFTGWTLNDGTKLTTFKADANTTVYATWEEIPDTTQRVSVKFEKLNGEPAETQTIVKGQTIGAFPTPKRDGYTLEGWYTKVNGEGDRAEAEKTVFNEGTTLYANWIDNSQKAYKFFANLNGGYVSGDSKQLTANSLDVLKAIVPTRDGYTFTGWYYDKAATKPVSGAALSADTTVYAGWTKNAEEYTLTYDVRGGNSIASVKFKSGAQAHTFPTPSRAGYTFDGWFDDATAGNKVSSITMDKDKTIFAHWTKITKPVNVYTITLVNGDDVQKFSYNEGTQVSLPTPTKDGYVFTGWHTDKDGGSRYSTISATRNLTLYANFEKIKDTYTVKFMDGDDELTSIAVKKGEALSDLYTPKKCGYQFIGWYDKKDGGEKITSVKAAEDVILYARWKEGMPVGNPTLTFNSMGGSEVPAMEVEPETRVESKDMPVPTKDGYTFLGWYTGMKDGQRIKSVVVNKDITVYAYWQKNGDETETETETPTPEPQPTTSKRYSIEIITLESRFKTVKVKDTVTLETLLRKVLGDDKYNEIARFTIKIGDDAEKDLSTEATMKDIADSIEGGDAKITAYDKDDKTIAYANVAKGSLAADGLQKYTARFLKESDTQETDEPETDETDKPNETEAPKSDDNKEGTKETNKGGKNTNANAGKSQTTGGDSNEAKPNENTGVKNAVSRYLLKVTTLDNKVSSVKVKDGVILSDLLKKLIGDAEYAKIAKLTVKTADSDKETELLATSALKNIAGLLEKGEIQIIAYDTKGEIIASAKVSKGDISKDDNTGESFQEYTVRFYTKEASQDMKLKGNDTTTPGGGTSTHDTPQETTTTTTRVKTGDNSGVVSALITTISATVAAAFVLFRKKIKAVVRK